VILYIDSALVELAISKPNVNLECHHHYHCYCHSG